MVRAWASGRSGSKRERRSSSAVGMNGPPKRGVSHTCSPAYSRPARLSMRREVWYGAGEGGQEEEDAMTLPMRFQVADEGIDVHVPDWVVDLESFRRWSDHDDFPETGQISYLMGQVW